MPLPLIPQKIAPALRHRLQAAKSASARVDVLSEAVAELVDQLNVERQRDAATVNTAGGQTLRGVPISADYDISSVDGVVKADTTAAGVTATLPSAKDYPDAVVRAVLSAGANTFTLAARGSDTIGGGASVSVTTPVSYHSDGVSNWDLV